MRIIALAMLIATSATYPAKKSTQKGSLVMACDENRETTLPSRSTSNEPIKNMGLVIDYGARRVDSVEFSETFDDIGGASIWFESPDKDLSGTIDRISGTVEVISRSRHTNTKEITAIMSYHLQCKPAKRMF